MDPERQSVLVIGDVLLDRRVEGTMTRISPEAPAPVLRATAFSDAPGGAANVAMNVASLGCPVQIVGIVGEDSAGQRLRESLAAAEGVWPHLLTAPGVITSAKTRMTSAGQQVLRVDDEKPLPEAVAAELVHTALEALRVVRVGVVIFSDYAKGAVSEALRLAVWAECVTRGIPIFVDTKPERFPFYAGATLVTPNLSEARTVLSTSVHPALAIETPDARDLGLLAGRQLRADYGYVNVLVTCGPDGAVWVGPEGEEHFPTKSRRVFDVTGAGDTFLAAMAVSLLDGLDLPTSVERANLAAGLAVEQHGVVAITRDDWEDARLKLAGYPAKHMSTEAVIEFAARAKRRGKTVVFTNGTFDLLHPGHLYLLDQAKRQGDVLIVAYNSDASVRRYKGPDRPLIPEDWRGVFLSINAYIDAVVRFDEDTPEHLIRKLKPDVFAKGREFVEANVPGADFVVTHGGRMFFVPMFTGYSTTAIKAQLENA